MDAAAAGPVVATSEDVRPASPPRAGSSRGGAGPRGNGLRIRGALPYLLIAPSVVTMVVLLGWPVSKLAAMSFQQLGLRELVQRETVWNGVDNYTAVLTDSEFWTVTLRTVLFTTANVVLTMVIGTLLAILLSRLNTGMRVFLSIGLVLAWAMPIISSVVIFQWLFDTQFGVVNWALTQLRVGDFHDHSWFADPMSVFAIVTLLIVWQAVPFVAFSLFAGLTSVSDEIYEAAHMDGAGAWNAFRHITYPALKPLFVVLTVLSIIWDFKVFTQLYAIRGSGIPKGNITLSVYSYLNGIGGKHFGTASAIALLMVLMLLFALVFYIRSTLNAEEER